MPRLGERVLFVQQTMKGSEKPARACTAWCQTPSVARFGWTSTSWRTRLAGMPTRPAHLAALAAEAQFTPTPGCSVFWSRTGRASREPPTRAPAWFSQRGSVWTMVIQDNLTLEGEILTIQDVAGMRTARSSSVTRTAASHQPLVQYYAGWSVVREGGPDYDKDAPTWQVHKGPDAQRGLSHPHG